MGNYIVVENAVYKVTYMHLESISVGLNDSVICGQSLGIMGTTGDSTGVHLHIQIWNKTAGKYVDPLSLFN